MTGVSDLAEDPYRRVQSLESCYFATKIFLGNYNIWDKYQLLFFSVEQFVWLNRMKDKIIFLKNPTQIQRWKGKVELDW